MDELNGLLDKFAGKVVQQERHRSALHSIGYDVVSSGNTTLLGNTENIEGEIASIKREILALYSEAKINGLQST